VHVSAAGAEVGRCCRAVPGGGGGSGTWIRFVPGGGGGSGTSCADLATEGRIAVTAAASAVAQTAARVERTRLERKVRLSTDLSYTGIVTPF